MEVLAFVSGTLFGAMLSALAFCVRDYRRERKAIEIQKAIRAWKARGILELVRRETGGQRARLN